MTESTFKTLILLADGTGNTFTGRSSNITRLAGFVDLTCPRSASIPVQIAFYDQGVGTNPKLAALAQEHGAYNPEALLLKFLPPPRQQSCGLGALSWLAGLAVGYGLRENVKELVRALAEHHASGDRIFMFGFSRGAFTVRAVAAFLYRCGLPSGHGGDFESWFAQGFEHFSKTEELAQALAFRQAGRRVDVDFLGLFDTVKSYGWLCPVAWPHLRHNPCVKNVRHALAMDEKRTWFDHTTWGSLKEEIKGIQLPRDPGYADQCVKEVWFRGCHSDVGGGHREATTAEVPLLWMLGEAAHCGLRLSAAGMEWYRDGDLERRVGDADIHESYTPFWRFANWVPRIELRNSNRPPLRRLIWRRSGKRDCVQPEWPNEKKQIRVHVSAVDGWNRADPPVTEKTRPPLMP